MIFISVDLPAPFSPTSPWISPGATAKSTDRRAATPPNVLVIPDSSNSAGMAKSDQEMRLHPHHSWRVGFGHHRSVDDDVLRDAAGAGLFPGNDRSHARDDRAAVNAAGWIAHR